MTQLLSTAEAARAVGVTPSTVKRWADAGLITCVKTAGGHRRFALSDVERAVRGAASAAAEAAPPTLVELLLGGRSQEVEAHLLQARARLGAWHRVADALGPTIEEIGRLWSEGRLSILEEHVASERLARALARIGEALPASPEGPRALLACAEGDEHTLGLSLVELSLREAGWQAVWSGRGTPTAELFRRIGHGDLALVALSASSRSRDKSALARQAGRLARACAAAGTALVLGGRGAWPDALAAPVWRLARLDELAALLRKLAP